MRTTGYTPGDAARHRPRWVRRQRWSYDRLDVSIGGAGLAGAAIGLGLVDELRMFRYRILVGGGIPFIPPVTEGVRLDLVETRTFGSRVIFERYRHIGLTPPYASWLGTV